LQQGQIVAEFSLPLVVLTGYGTAAPKETLVPAVLQFRVPGAGGSPCSASTVTGNFKAGSTAAPQTLATAQVGVNCAVVFAPSPLSMHSHAIFEVAVPLVVTMATDPLYFFNPIANVGSPFTTDETGFPAGTDILGSAGSIGIAPSAAPLCSTTGTCASPTFALCADLPGGDGNGQGPVPAAAAYYAISTAGETLLSAALPSFSTSVCPF
jgi:hypothetical protein